MSECEKLLEYECPCCGAALKFSGSDQKLSCEYCSNSFELEAVREYNAIINESIQDAFVWEDGSQAQWDPEEQVDRYICQSCGGEIMAEKTTAATFCPYCDSHTILAGRVSEGLRPDGVIPFKTTKEDAKKAFLALCKGKKLLPDGFTSEQRLEKITGVYVPFWLYDCSGSVQGQYRATRIRRWSDSRYHYTKTDHYMLHRSADAGFCGIPMDGSSKMDNAIMESIEPFDMSAVADFDTAYLSGYLADKYDVESSLGQERIRQRVDATMDDMITSSIRGYTGVMAKQKNLQVTHSKAKYMLLPVWMLCSKYQDKTYIFAMNGQTGKMTGTLPIDKKKTRKWFAGITAIGAAAGALLGLLVMIL